MTRSPECRSVLPDRLCLVVPMGVAAVLCLPLISVLHAASDPAKVTWRRGAYLEPHTPERPWESKGLTPVGMKPQAGVAAVTLCQRGSASLPIVTPARGKPRSGYCRQIAGFLKKYLDAATGAAFEIVGDDTAPARGIVVGPCAHEGLEPFIERAGRLEPEHFLVSAFAGGVALIGRDIKGRQRGNYVEARMTSWSDSRGTFFAAVDFLERFIGVRFYMPGDLGTCIPYLNDRVVTMPAVGYTDGPVFEMRKASTGNYLTKDHQLLGYTRRQGVEWMFALRVADYYGWKSGHTDTDWHKYYAEEHPDWFAMRPDGSRMVGKRGAHSSQRCYTNEEAFQEHLRIIERYYETREGRDKFHGLVPNEKYIYWWPNDGFRGCACEGCLALTDEDGPYQARLSRLIWGYTAKLARAVGERWPGKTLIGSFYSAWSAGPGDIKLPGNVSFMLVETREAYLKEPVYWDRVTKDLDAKMSLVKSPVALWSHYPHRPRIANRMDAPYLVPHYLQKYVRYLRGKSSGVYMNGHQTMSFALDGHGDYVYKKLLWNPELDVDAALDEYCRLMFGPASPQVAQYYRTVIDRWENTQWKDLTEDELSRPHGGLKWTRYYKDTYPRDVRMKLKAVLAKALAQVEKGTEYHAKTEYLVKGVEPFFAQGEFLDRGAMLTTECARLTPKVDGSLSEWESTQPLIMKNNISGADVSARTEVYCAYDAERFYFAVSAHEPGEIKALPAGGDGMRDKLPLWRNDSIEVFLCTEQPGIKEAMLNITDQYYQFIIDPNGNVFDGYKAIGATGRRPLDRTVTVAFEHAEQRTDSGYVIEAAIPYAAINAVPPKPGSYWIANFYRNRPRKDLPGEPIHAWSPTLASAHNVARFGKLTFPTRTLWRSDFNDLNKLGQKIWAYRDDIKFSHEVHVGEIPLGYP